MELGLKDVEFHVKKSIAPQEICYNSPLVREKAARSTHLLDGSIGTPYIFQIQ